MHVMCSSRSWSGVQTGSEITYIPVCIEWEGDIKQNRRIILFHYLFIYLCLFIHLLLYLFIHSFIDLLIHSFTSLSILIHSHLLLSRGIDTNRGGGLESGFLVPIINLMVVIQVSLSATQLRAHTKLLSPHLKTKLTFKTSNRSLLN